MEKFSENTNSSNRSELIEAKEKTSKVLNHVGQMRNYFFWKAPEDENERREYENENSFVCEFEHEGRKYDLRCITKCRNGRIHYKTVFLVDGERITIREVRKLSWKVRESLWLPNAYCRDGKIIHFDSKNPLPYY